MKVGIAMVTEFDSIEQHHQIRIHGQIGLNGVLLRLKWQYATGPRVMHQATERHDRPRCRISKHQHWDARSWEGLIRVRIPRRKGGRGVYCRDIVEWGLFA
jgi:hypothetical protein